MVLGLPLAWLLARVRFPGRALVRGLVLLPLVLPPVVGGVALLGAFSRRGLVGAPLYDWFGVQLTFSTAGAVLAETFVALPFFVLTAEAGLRSIDRRYEEVATTLGARPAEVFGRVTLPMLAPAVVAGAVLAWARALGEFGATITFAGNIEGRTRTLPLAVYLLLDSDPDVAIALSLVLLVLSLVVLVSLRDRWTGAAERPSLIGRLRSNGWSVGSGQSGAAASSQQMIEWADATRPAGIDGSPASSAASGARLSAPITSHTSTRARSRAG